MNVLITLTTAGTDTGPFDLFSNVDNYTIPIDGGISRAALLSGYTCTTVPPSATTIRVKSLGTCTNYINIPIVYPTTTTTTSTVAPTTTTTTTGAPGTTTTTTTGGGGGTTTTTTTGGGGGTTTTTTTSGGGGTTTTTTTGGGGGTTTTTTTTTAAPPVTTTTTTTLQTYYQYALCTDSNVKYYTANSGYPSMILIAGQCFFGGSGTTSPEGTEFFANDGTCDCG